MTRLLKPVSIVLRSIETAKSKGGSKTPSSIPVVFIVGVPRSGTTLAYQCLTHCLNVDYPSNLAALFPDSPGLGLLLGRAVRRGHSHRDFTSVHGYSLGSPLNGPSEWEVMFRRIVYPEIEKDAQFTGNLYSSSLGLIGAYGSGDTRSGLILKTLNAIYYSKAIMQHLPEARFLYIQRSPLEIARSIFRAKRREGKLGGLGWYVVPDSMKGQTYPTEAHDVCAQIKTIHDDICRTFSSMESWRWESLSYEDLCRDPVGEISRVLRGMRLSFPFREQLSLPPLECADSKPLSNQTYEEILAKNLKEPMRPLPSKTNSSSQVDSASQPVHLFNEECV